MLKLVYSQISNQYTSKRIHTQLIIDCEHSQVLPLSNVYTCITDTLICILYMYFYFIYIYLLTYPIGDPACISPFTKLLFSSDTLVVNKLAIAGKYTPRNVIPYSGFLG